MTRRIILGLALSGTLLISGLALGESTNTTSVQTGSKLPPNYLGSGSNSADVKSGIPKKDPVKMTSPNDGSKISSTGSINTNKINNPDLNKRKETGGKAPR